MAESKWILIGFTKCKCCGDEIARFKDQKPEPLCADCVDRQERVAKAVK